MIEIPEHLIKYPCADYFTSEFSERGFWDEAAQLWLIDPALEVEELPEAGFLQVGRPGVDGIGFGYRNGTMGFWAYHPMEARFQLLASTLEEFLKEWYSGKIRI